MWAQADLPYRWLAVIVLSLACTPALACSCIHPFGLSEFEDIARAFEDADEVFSADVEALSSENAAPTDMVWAHLRVLQIWKGPHLPGSRLRAFTRNDPYLHNCAMELDRGDVLLVYRTSGPAETGISLCSRSGPLRRALPDLTTVSQLAKRRAADTLFSPTLERDELRTWLGELVMDIYIRQYFARARARH